MGDIDGSSRAAQSAQLKEQDRSFWHRVIDRVLGKNRNVQNSDVEGDQPPSLEVNNQRGMINLRRLQVEDVAIPKAEIVAVSENTSKEELVKVFRDSGLTRIPVYSGTLDTPIGMAHLKDFALKYGFQDELESFELAPMLRPLLFVPLSMPIGVLLAKMQTERRHMALVIDEYGGVDGLVTIEDLIEQVVGEIEDEHDSDEDTFWTMEKSGQFLALAKTPLEEFSSFTQIDFTQAKDIDAEEVETLGGLVFMLAGRVPVRGEVIQHPQGAEFEVVDADPRRVKRLRVRLHSLTKAAE